MGFFKKLLGICETQPPADASCWRFENGEIRIDLSKAKELSAPGGAIRLEDNGLPERVLVMRTEDDQWVAYRNRCSHGGRRLDPIENGHKVRCCSVGQTTFDKEGHVLSGSGKKDIKVYPIEAVDDGLVVRIG